MNISKSVPKGVRLAIVLVSIVFAIAMISISYHAYVVVPHKLTLEILKNFLENILRLPLDLLVEVYLISYVRYRMWTKGFRLPYGIKVTFALLIIASILSLLTITFLFEQILNVLPPVPFWCIWIADSLFFVPLFFTWLMFPRRKEQSPDENVDPHP